MITEQSLSAEIKQQIFDIWNSVYPAQVTFPVLEKFEAYLSRAADSRNYLYFKDDNRVAGWLMTFTRDGQRNFVMLVSQDCQGRGIGRELLETLKQSESQLVVGWAVESESYLRRDGSPYRSPISFYRKNGFEITNQRQQQQDFEVAKITLLNSGK
jgi:GNAT superfamily N-acetyltransferase